MRHPLPAAVLLLCSAATGFAQAPPPVVPDLPALAASRDTYVHNRALTAGTEDGRAAVRLDARTYDGGVLIPGVLLGEGVIDVDLKGQDVLQQSFLGIAFHVVDWTQLDAVYFRPFNFRAADPARRAHAVQFVSHPAYPWPRLRAERPGQFEQPVDPPPDPNGWFHARIVLKAGRVEVFVNGAATPSLSVEDLGAAASGGVALWAGNGSGGAFANLRITPTMAAAAPPESSQNVFQAAATGNLARLRALVEADPAAVRARNADDMTALHTAALFAARPTAEYLAAHGADLDAEARHAGRPMDVAFEAGHRDFAAWLAAKGAHATPLHFDTADLAPGVRRLAFPWGMRNNIVSFSGPDGAVVVDTGFSARAVDEVRRLVGTTTPAGVRFVVNTHAHGDHVKGNALAPSPQAVITAAALAAGSPPFPVTKAAQPMTGRTGRTLPAPYVLKAGGLDLLLIPRPGLHSEADLLVYAPAARVVAMGDMLLSESVPALDDIAGYLAFLDDVLDVFPEQTTFVSGHGRDLDTAGVRAYRDTLREMAGLVRAGMAAGKTAEQMAREGVLAPYRQRFSLLAFLPVDAFIPRAMKALQAGALK